MKAYQALIKLQHLTEESEIKWVNQLLKDLESKQYLNLQAPAYAYIAKLQANKGNIYESKQYLNKAIETLTLIKSDELYIDALENISWMYFIQGNYTKAITYAQQMANIAYRINNKRGQIIAFNRLGLTYFELKLYQLAMPPLQKALMLARQSDNKDSEFLTLLYIINTRLKLNDINQQETLALILAAQKIPSKFNTDDGYLARLKGIVNQNLANKKLAKQWLNKAKNKAEAQHDIRLLAMVNQNLSEYYLKNQQAKLALPYALNSLKFTKEVAHSTDIAALSYLISQIYQQLGDDQKALNYLIRYADFQYSATEKGIVNLITSMDKRLENIKQQQKLTQLENTVLANKVGIEKSKNEQQVFTFVIFSLALILIFLTVLFFTRYRMMKMQVALSMRDSLTGAYCRNYLKEYLPSVKSRFERNKSNSLSLGAILIDCDDFKLINENYGHAGGDNTLKAIVKALGTHVRDDDLLFRWGGDEFVLVCEAISQQQLKELAQRLSNTISTLTIEHDNQKITTTISVGYALHEQSTTFNFSELIKKADIYLYQSKNQGKNTACGGTFSSLNLEY